MILLNDDGNIVDNATAIIDSLLPVIDSSKENYNSINQAGCIPSVLDNKIISALSSIADADKNGIDALKSYQPKVYGITSRKLADLNSDFNPIAECIVAFVDQWCSNGGASIGSEELSAWVLGKGWAGGGLAGFSHSAGSTDPLQERKEYKVDQKYLIKYDISNYVSGYIEINVGGLKLENIKASGYTSNIFIKSDSLVVRPSNDFIGTLKISIKLNDGSTYGYEIVSTKRSWYGQRKILTDADDSHNGLSWNLYGNGMSLLVYKNTVDQLNEFSQQADIVRTSINLEDGSAKVFIEDAQEWFNKHKTRDGKNIKIYGVYPNLKTVLSKSKYELIAMYRDDVSVVYWGGLFSNYPNFTQWEYHPGMMPNEVYKVRQEYLNSSFVSDGNENLLDKITNNEAITYSEAKSRSNPFGNALEFITGSNDNIERYLAADIEMIEEDFISFYTLKTNINTSKRIFIKDIFTWAIANPASLKQTIMYYQVQGDLTNTTLFFNVARDLNTVINTDEQEASIRGSNIFSLVTQNGEYLLSCVDMFGETLTFNLNNSFRLPFDYLPSDDDFDIINLSDNEYNESTENPLENTSQIADELTKTSQLYTRPVNEVNEFGPLTAIDINPRNLLPNIDALANEISRERIFEEMITPPDSIYGKEAYKGTVLDITTAGKRNAAAKSPIGDENVTPDLIE
jgi:hypothetical protein